MILRRDALQAVSTKEKKNATGPSKADLLTFDNILPRPLWTKQFFSKQVYHVEIIIILRDSQATMKLEISWKNKFGKEDQAFQFEVFS